MAAGGGGLLLVVMMIVMNIMGVDRDKQQAAIGIAKAIQQKAANQGPAEPGEGINDASRVFISQILKSTEDVWTQQFQDHVQGGSYTPPKLVIFGGSVETRCGMGMPRWDPSIVQAIHRFTLTHRSSTSWLSDIRRPAILRRPT